MRKHIRHKGARRFLSLLLCFLLIGNTFGVTVFAEENPEPSVDGSSTTDESTPTGGMRALELESGTFFSVKFTYHITGTPTKEYVIPGNATINLSDILEALGLGGREAKWAWFGAYGLDINMDSRKWEDWTVTSRWYFDGTVEMHVDLMYGGEVRRRNIYATCILDDSDTFSVTSLSSDSYINNIPPALNNTYVYMGGYKWWVIGKSSDKLLLLSDDVIRDGMLVSEARDYCGVFYNQLSKPEQNAILPTSRTEAADDSDKTKYYLQTKEGNTYPVYVAPLDQQKVFLPSVKEVYIYPAVRSGYASAPWWTRSRGVYQGADAGFTARGYGRMLPEREEYTAAFRPAFTLDLSRDHVLMMTPAAGEKTSVAAGSGVFGAISDISGTEGAEMKLTLVDEDISGFSAQLNKIRFHPGDTITVTYSGAEAGENRYVSAILCDENGQPLYYASITAEAGSWNTWDLVIPEDLPAGETGFYTLEVFTEQRNGDYVSDLCSKPVKFTLVRVCTIQFNISPADAGQVVVYNESIVTSYDMPSVCSEDEEGTNRYSIPYNSAIIVSAVPENGYHCSDMSISGKFIEYNGYRSKRLTANSDGAVYTVDFAWNIHTITFKNWDGTLLQSISVAEDEVPVYTGDTPARAADADFAQYNFTGWSPEITAATGDATYTAQFEGVPYETCSITFRSGGGSGSMQNLEVEYGSVFKLPDVGYSPMPGAVFAGWRIDDDYELKAPGYQFSVTRLTVITAIWKKTIDSRTCYSWPETDRLPAQAGNYFLACDITTSDPWSTPDGTTYLYLHGKTVDTSGTITVNSGSVLYLIDDFNGLLNANGSTGMDVCGACYIRNAAIRHTGTKVGIQVQTDASLQIANADISNCRVTGQVILNYGTTIIDDINFSGNFSGNNSSNSLIQNQIGGTLRINGGTFTRNIGYMGGVFYTAGTLEINGGTFTRNRASECGGVIRAIGGRVSVSGGTFTGNIATSTRGGAIFSEENNIIVSGNPVIAGNTANGSRIENNIHLGGSTSTLKIGKLTEGAMIGVSAGSSPRVFAQAVEGYTLTADDVKHLFSDDLTYHVRLNGDNNAEFYKGAEVYPITIDSDIEDLGSVAAQIGGQTITEAAEGDLINLTVVPSAGLGLTRFIVTDGSGQEITLTNNTFNMPASEVFVTAEFYAVPYPYTVNGWEINLVCKSGPGWSFEGDETGGTLTLTNANLVPYAQANNQCIYAGAPLTIVLVGENTVSGLLTGIDAADSLTIQGSGSLNVSGSAYGIRASNGLTVTGGANITAAGGDYGITGTSAAGAVVIEGNSTVEASGGKNGVSVNSLAVRSSTLTATGTGNTGISAAGAVSIEGNSTVEASGGENGVSVNSLTVRSSSLTANGIGKAGISAAGAIVFENNSTVTASGAENGISTDTLKVTDSTLTATGTNKTGVTGGIVTFESGATVTMTGGEQAVLAGWLYNYAGIETPYGGLVNDAGTTIVEHDGTTVPKTVVIKPGRWIYVTTDGHGTAETSLRFYKSGDQVTLTAVPDEGYRFKEWVVTNYSGGTASLFSYAEGSSAATEESTFTITRNRNLEFKATFVPEEPEFKGHQLVLSGQIGMHFYMNIPEGMTDGTMTFTVGDRTVTAAGALQSDGRYKFTCYVNSVEMAEEITAAYSYTSGEETKTVTDTTSVKEYLEVIINNENGLAAYTAATPLAKAIYNYGYYAMQAVPGGSKHPAMPDTYVADMPLITSLEGYAISATLDKNVITKASYSLDLDSETTINFYLTSKTKLTKTNVSVTADGATFAYKVEKVGSRYRVQITGIGARELGTVFTMTTGNTTISASAMTYVQQCLANANASTATKNAAAALYAYYQQAISYNN